MKKDTLLVLSISFLLLSGCTINSGSDVSSSSSKEESSSSSSLAYSESTSSMASVSESSVMESESESSSIESSSSEKSVDRYESRLVDVYRSKEGVDKQIPIRFYEDTPHVPYIGVKDFYQEFFHTGLTSSQAGSLYTYEHPTGAYLHFDSNSDVMGIYGFSVFSTHPDFKEESAKSFFLNPVVTSTARTEKVISLRNYHIDIHGDGEAYVPLTLLSSMSGGTAAYNVAYNGKSIFVLDARGSLTGEDRNSAYFGDLYTEVQGDLDTPREMDFAKYNYYQLCLNIDHFRGYTQQLMFGDNNLLSLGLNGLLEYYYPDIRSALLSTDKKTYYIGLNYLFYGLYDGGHTAGEFISLPFFPDVGTMTADYPALTQFSNDFSGKIMQRLLNATTYMKVKSETFPEIYNPNQKIVNYYTYNADCKTAYMGFDSFEYDLNGWDNYYNNGMKEEDIPLDSYGFIRQCLYKALDDNAKNVVLDLSTNGGGNSAALNGIFGLLNGGKAVFEMNDVVDRSRVSEKFDIDINLDGVFDAKDVEESNKFKSLKIAVLTSPNSFSCGNLLPSILKEIGYKIVGQRSGGGSCAIAYESTADGLTYYRSSNLCLSNAKGENIDSGVPLDFEIDVSQSDDPDGGLALQTINPAKFYDFTTIATYLDSLD